MFITVAAVSATANPAVVTTASDTNITRNAVLLDTLRRFCSEPIIRSTNGVIAMAMLNLRGRRNCCAIAKPATLARKPPHCPAAKGVKPAWQMQSAVMQSLRTDRMAEGHWHKVPLDGCKQ